jgi:hypothetical protein
MECHAQARCKGLGPYIYQQSLFKYSSLIFSHSTFIHSISFLSCSSKTYDMKFFHSFALAAATFLPLIPAAPSPVSRGYGAADAAPEAPVSRAAGGYRNAAYFVNW